jgi:hypothetical protein
LEGYYGHGYEHMGFRKILVISEQAVAQFASPEGLSFMGLIRFLIFYNTGR